MKLEFRHSNLEGIIVEDPTKRSLSSIWSLPLLCLGLSIIAVCVLVPAAEANKRLTADRDKLERDLSYVESQVSANQDFLSVAGSDPEIAERLAQRQLKQIRQGTMVLELKGVDHKTDASPFQMISVSPPPLAAEYRPLDGILGEICRDTHRQLYVVGLGMFMVATALVLGVSGTVGQPVTAQDADLVIRHCP